MADVNIIPRIRCDNCGLVVEKTAHNYSGQASFSRPAGWGSARIDDGRRSGYPEHIGMTDLCPECAQAACDAADSALKARREPGSGNVIPMASRQFEHLRKQP